MTSAGSRLPAVAPAPATAPVAGVAVYWRGPGGSIVCVLRESGQCSIFHEDTAEVGADELHGLPLRWAPLSSGPNAGWSCAELPCGHTFHVSALALHFLSLDMR